MIRLIIADDHALVRSGLKQLLALSSDVLVVGEAVNGAEVLQQVRSVPADVVLLDLNMPGISGTDLIGRAKACNPDVAILVLTMHNEPQVAVRMLKAGASGYLSKDCEPEVLLAAIGKVAAKGQYIAPDLAQRMVFELTASSERPLHTLLSDRESEIFALMASGKTVNEIALLLIISNKTVSTHKVRMMEKMKFTSMADLMRYAIAHGMAGEPQR